MVKQSSQQVSTSTYNVFILPNTVINISKACKFFNLSFQNFVCGNSLLNNSQQTGFCPYMTKHHGILVRYKNNFPEEKPYALIYL